MRVDPTGEFCVAHADDRNYLNDWIIEGGGVSGGGGSGYGYSSSSGTRYNGSTSEKMSGNTSTSSRTEVHHVVEQCQTYKSGFSNDMIQANSNKVVLDYSVHRKNKWFLFIQTART